MTSPFAPYVNFTADFEISSGALVADASGNLRPGKAVVVVTAVMEQSNGNPRRDSRPGVDSTLIWLEGTLVEPAPLPSTITPDTYCMATFDGRRGQFWMEFVARDPFVAAAGITFVEDFRGWFQPGSFVEPQPPAPDPEPDPEPEP